jgi:hypothetical protein
LETGIGQKPLLIDKGKRMAQLPKFVIIAREEANVAADAHADAWEELQAIAEPTHEDVEKWVEVREKFYSAQEKFEKLLWQAIGR